LREKHDVRHVINELHKLLPPEIANTEQAKRLYEHGCVTEILLHRHVSAMNVRTC
jgi:NTE family protein